eukprot:scaffold304136_cov21-Tisochrysis_lutea.AAC.1
MFELDKVCSHWPGIFNHGGAVVNKNNPQGLEGVERRWVQFGGGAASPEQVAWFKQQLQCLISNT